MGMTEAEIERLIDARVQRRLATDREYRNAENAEQQSAREEAITREVEREVAPMMSADFGAISFPAGRSRSVGRFPDGSPNPYEFGC